MSSTTATVPLHSHGQDRQAPGRRQPQPSGCAKTARPHHDYDILDTYEAGLVLVGSEVKSLREGKAQLRDSYARVQEGEVWLYGGHVPPYVFATGFGARDPQRRRT